MSAIHVCAARYDEERVSIRECPTCGSKQPILFQHEDYYGWTVTCLTCGDMWIDGERCERPFQRGWREERIRLAKERIEELGLEWNAKERFKYYGELGMKIPEKGKN